MQAQPLEDAYFNVLILVKFDTKLMAPAPDFLLCIYKDKCLKIMAGLKKKH